jgi:hypothetical protein
MYYILCGPETGTGVWHDTLLHGIFEKLWHGGGHREFI